MSFISGVLPKKVPGFWKRFTAYREFQQCFPRLVETLTKISIKHDEKRKNACSPSLRNFTSENYWEMILTVKFAQIFHICFRPEVEKILENNQNGFQRNRSTIFQFLSIQWIIEIVRAKNLKTKCNAFDSMHRAKIEQIQAHGLPKETLTRENDDSQIHLTNGLLSDGKADFFDIVSCDLNQDTFAPYLFIISLDYIL